MPKLDQTGPRGEGPNTGRGLGRCNKENDVQTKKDFSGLGRVSRQGRGCKTGLRQNQRNTPLRNQN